MTVGPNGDVYMASHFGTEGMTLLDHFAGQVMQSLVRSITDHNIMSSPNIKSEEVLKTIIGFSAVAYEAAAAMVAEKRRREGGAS